MREEEKEEGEGKKHESDREERGETYVRQVEGEVRQEETADGILQ